VIEHKYFVFRFGDIEVTEREFRLVRAGVIVPVEPKAFRVLQILLRNSGRLVTKDEILNAVWNDCSVSENSLTRSIAALRKVLGDDIHKPRYIATVPTVGYRLICRVDVSEETRSGQPALALLETVTGSVDKEVRKTGSSPGSAFLDSIAVLPFENGGGEPEMEYLSDGITTSIINNLSQLNRLRVVPRTTAFRYKGRASDVAQAGRELRVRVVLTGQVTQRGDELTINVELIDTSHESQLWGGDYHGQLEDVLSVQAAIAEEITNRLRLRPNDEERKQLAQCPTESREAYHLYLKAMHWGDKCSAEGVRKSIDYARQAIDADPAYAEAWTALAYLYAVIGSSGDAPSGETFPRAKAAAVKALQIDDGEAGAHAVLAYVRLVYDWDLQGARKELLRAIEVGPHLPIGHSVYSQWYLAQGLYEEALAEAKLALDIDPLSAPCNYSFGEIHYFSGRYDQAVEELSKTIELNPLWEPAYPYLAFSYARKGMRHAAIAAFEKVSDLSKSNFRYKGQWGIVNVMTGEPLGARRVLDELRQELGPPNFLSAYHCAVLHALLGEKNEAFACLEMAWHGRSVWLVNLAVAPHLESLYDDPRFLDLLRRIGIPVYRT
jgi:TolB-like protein/Tfp pilus assembly protein PilF